MALKKRIIGLPQTTATTNSGSPIAWGTSSMLPTDTATVKLPKPATPASVTNPSSLTPWTTVKSFSDNMTMPIGVGEVKQPVTPKPAQTPQGNPIGQNVDGSYIYEQSKPTTPATTETTTTTPATGTPITGITSPKPEFSWSLYDANNYLGSWKTKEEFTAMNINDQTNLINQAVQNVEERQAILDQVKVYAENKAQQEYQAKQNAIRTGIDQSQTTSAEIQASQRIREAQTNLDNMKQNLGFLGTGGRPMKSATAIEWASRMLMQSEQTFQELKNLESQAKTMREAGLQMNANQYEEQMRQLQKQLTDSVDASIIQAMQWFDSEAALASIDSPKKLFDLQQKYLDMVDTSVEGITNRQVNEMKNLQTRYADYAKQFAEDLKQRQTQQAEFTKNKNTLNENMSKAVGYYVDWNGSPLQTTDGKVIEYKDEADKPIIDWNTWKVAYFNTDANGNQVVEIKQLFTPEQKAPSIEKVWVWADWKDIYGYYDSATGQVKTVSTPSQTTWGAWSTAIDTIKKWEWFRDKAYQDSVWKRTIGYWFTNVNWQPVQPWMTMDRWTADALLQQEINQRQNYMNYITVPLSDSQKAALSSFEYNLWSGIREKKEWWAMQVLNKINQWDLAWAAEYMKQFNKWRINWVLTPIQWLSNRRNEEARLLQTKDAQPTEVADKRMAVQWLIQWLWGTEWERATFANNIIKVAERDWITLQEAKKKLGYKSWDDIEFAKTRADQFKTIKKSSDAITKWKQALSLLNSGKATAIKDVATIVWFLKTIDPNSVARESEVDSVENARWVLDSLSNTFEKMNTGKKLTDAQRQELKDTIGIIVNEYENNMKDFITSSSQEFDDRGLDMTVYVPKDTVNKYKQMQSTQQTTWTLSWWTNRLKK